MNREKIAQELMKVAKSLMTRVPSRAKRLVEKDMVKAIKRGEFDEPDFDSVWEEVYDTLSNSGYVEYDSPNQMEQTEEVRGWTNELADEWLEKIEEEYAGRQASRSLVAGRKYKITWFVASRHIDKLQRIMDKHNIDYEVVNVDGNEMEYELKGDYEDLEDFLVGAGWDPEDAEDLIK